MEEYTRYGFTGKVKVPREIRDVKNSPIKILGFRLTLKELGYSILAVIVFAVVFLLLYMVLGAFHAGTALSAGICGVSGIVAAFPIFWVTFRKPYGMDYRDWMLVKKSNKRSVQIRKNDGLNEYEKLEALYDRSQKKRKKTKATKQKKKKTEKTAVKGKKKKKEKSVIMAFH